ncbi:MAG: right-handed parallel beta-helix repeat-containing protein [Bacteroidia bacterium]
MLFAWMVIFFPAKATILTVDNNPNSGGQYNNLTAAITAASVGDTIYIIGSQVSYGSPTISKKLTLIGAGYNPSNQFGLRTTLDYIYFSTSVAPNTTSSGSKVMGIQCSGIYGNASNVNDIVIERTNASSISLTTNNNGWIIQNNIIDYIYINYNSNILIRNNIIKGQIYSTSQPSVLVSNNVFTGTPTAGTVFSTASHLIITNNIFYYGRSPQGTTLSTYNNNIAYFTPNDTMVIGTNTGSGNLINVNPQFVNAPSGTFDYAYDYQLKSNSQGKNAGTDGTDIGAYGSLNPFPIGGVAPFITSAMPAVPQVIELNILNSSILQGDSLQVHVKARKQN